MAVREAFPAPAMLRLQIGLKLKHTSTSSLLRVQSGQLRERGTPSRVVAPRTISVMNFSKNIPPPTKIGEGK